MQFGLLVLPTLFFVASPVSVHGANCTEAQVLAFQQAEMAGCQLWLTAVGATINIDKSTDVTMCKNETCVENLHARAVGAPNCEAYGVNMKMFFNLSAQYCGNETQVAYVQLQNITNDIISQRKGSEYQVVPAPNAPSSDGTKASRTGVVKAGIALGLATALFYTSASAL